MSKNNFSVLLGGVFVAFFSSLPLVMTIIEIPMFESVGNFPMIEYQDSPRGTHWVDVITGYRFGIGPFMFFILLIFHLLPSRPIIHTEKFKNEI